jgi:hypothetical protein
MQFFYFLFLVGFEIKGDCVKFLFSILVLKEAFTLSSTSWTEAEGREEVMAGH